MTKNNGNTTQTPEQKPAEVVEAEVTSPAEAHTPLNEKAQDDEKAQDIDEALNSLKVLLTAVEKLQKVRLEVGDIKPIIIRMLEGELVDGSELEQLKTGVAGLSRLVKAYTDHRSALEKAQPARKLLDDILK